MSHEEESILCMRRKPIDERRGSTMSDCVRLPRLMKVRTVATKSVPKLVRSADQRVLPVWSGPHVKAIVSHT
jgi:hypothetical protein